MKKLFYTILISLGFIFSILLINSCSKENDFEAVIQTNPNNQAYLVIEGLSQKFDQYGRAQLTPQEKEIMYKTFDRIFEHARNKKGDVDLSHMSAKSLNIEPLLFEMSFNILALYITGEKTFGGTDQTFSPRIKTRSENEEFPGGFPGGGGGALPGGGGGAFPGGGGGGGGIFNEYEMEQFLLHRFTKEEMFVIICSGGGLSSFEKKCFHQFWYAKGDMILSPTDWEAIKKVTNTTGYELGRVSFEGSKKYYTCSVNFYKQSEYKYALGTSSITFTEAGVPVGLYDRYDFDIWKDRSLSAEVITCSMNFLGKIYGAKDFNMEYGIHK